MGSFARVRRLTRVGTLGMALALAAAGCGSTEGAATGQLQTNADSLLFPTAMVGQRREASVLLLNSREQPRRVRFLSNSDAFEPPSSLDLPALGFREVRVRFTPGEKGQFTGRLRVEADDGEALELGLVGLATPQPACVPLGPCRTARLDVEAGACVDAMQADGTACGAGACAGRCEAGTCVTGGGALSAAWRYAPPEGRALRFPGLVDTGGNVYWYEYAAGTGGEACELVSASRDGLRHYRIALGPARCASTQPGTLLLVREQLVLGVQGQPEWRARADGQLLWRPDLTQALANAMGVAPTQVVGSTLQAMAAGRAGHVYALVSAATQAERATLLLRLDPERKHVQPLRRFEPDFVPTHLVMDELDRVFLGDALRGELRALDWEGFLSWSRPLAGIPRAAWGDRVWTDAGAVLDAQTGQMLYTRPLVRGGDSPGPVGGEALAFAWTPDEAGGAGVKLAALDVRTGQARWSLAAPRPSAPLYTARSSVLLPTAEAQGGGLLELAADGSRLQEQSLCEQETLQADWGLHAGRVFGTAQVDGALQVRAYDLPERVEAAARGWSAEHGNLTRTGAPR